MLLISLDSYAQSGKVPPFKIVQANGEIFHARNLPLGKPIIVYYFSPECEECESLLKQLIGKVEEFKNASIVLITYFPLNEVKQYVAKFSLDKYPNIYVGTEGSSMFVANYYKSMDFPYLVLYNKNGDLIKIFNQAENLKEIITQLKGL